MESKIGVLGISALLGARRWPGPLSPGICHVTHYLASQGPALLAKRDWLGVGVRGAWLDAYA